MVRIVSWNVNGIRTLQPTLKAALDTLDADIICLQETKISSNAAEQVCLVPGYHSFFSFCSVRVGYSGTATFTRTPSKTCGTSCVTPVDAGEGFDNNVGGANADWWSHIESTESESPCKSLLQVGGLSAAEVALICAEGRVVITDHAHFVCINIYAPAVSVEGRVEFKRAFNLALELKVRALQRAGRRVLIAGDFNISPAVADVAEKVTSLTEFNARPSRAWLRDVMFRNMGLVDSFREMNVHLRGAYTCWSEATRAREKNFGARIDLMVVDRRLYEEDVEAVGVLREVYGSDHCPVSLQIRDEPFIVNLTNRGSVGEPPAFCTKFFKRFSSKQSSIASFVRKAEQNVVPSRTEGGVYNVVEGVTAGKSGKRLKPPQASLKPKTTQKRARRKSGNQLPIGAFFTRSVAQTAVSTSVNVRTESSGSAFHRIASIEAEAETHHADNSVAGKAAEKSLPAKSAICDAKVTSNADNARKWQRLLSGPPPPPLCRHREPCVLKGVKKSGENRGRTFFSCSRPAGQWPTDWSASCNFFSWAPYKASALPKR